MPVVQRLKKHAAAFIEQHSLGIEADYTSVKTYIDDATHPVAMRRGLLRAWNKGPIGPYVIATPSDLQTTSTQFESMEDLAEWNSDDEDSWDMKEVMGKRQLGTIDLLRSGKIPDLSGIPQLGLLDAIRLGRQVNKREEYDRLPMSVDIGGNAIEYDNPGTKDIYATPLEEVPREGVKGRKSRLGRRFKRTGQSKEFNWKTLAKNLDRAKYPDARKRQIRMLQFFLRRGKALGLDGPTAEALAAMGSDLMKGSRGGRHFLWKTLRALKTNKDERKFSELFSGNQPLYEPAAEGGRGMVTVAHRQIQFDANRLLGVNNCLINAIAQAAGLPNANLGQLMRIRERFNNYGEMMLATDETIAVIREVLGIQYSIVVVYQDRESEDFEGVGGPLLIYHVNGDHFTDQMPHDFVRFEPKKKKKKKGSLK